MYTLEGVSKFVNFITAYVESQLSRDFNVLCVICFQGQSFLLFFWP